MLAKNQSLHTRRQLTCPRNAEKGTAFAGDLPFKLDFQISLAIWILLPFSSVVCSSVSWDTPWQGNNFSHSCNEVTRPCWRATTLHLPGPSPITSWWLWRCSFRSEGSGNHSRTGCTCFSNLCAQVPSSSAVILHFNLRWGPLQLANWARLTQQRVYVITCSPSSQFLCPPNNNFLTKYTYDVLLLCPRSSSVTAMHVLSALRG